MLSTFFDKKFYQNKGKYITQCVFTTVAILMTLLALNVMPNAVVLAAIGATTFIVFSLPHKESSRTRYIVGGYIIGILVGSLCHVFEHNLFPHHYLHSYYDEIFGAIAVGLSMFFMVILNLEHPPAAGIALGMVLYSWSLTAVAVTIFAISILLYLRYLMRDSLIDLI